MNHNVIVCGQLRSLDEVRPIVRHHHERRDGTGYPDGLKGEAIPLLARILNVVDSYDALTTERPYRPALPPDEAFREIRAEAAKGWKFPDLVEEFAALDLTGLIMEASAQTAQGPFRSSLDRFRD